MNATTPEARLRVALAEDDQATAYALSKAIQSIGHEVLFTARTGEELVERTRSTHPDLILADIRLSGTDGISACCQACLEKPLPFILISAYFEPELLRRAEQSDAMAYLVKPVEAPDLQVAIPLALRRFAQIGELRKEADDLRRNLQERKQIERAKGVVMRLLGIGEEDAYRRMRKYASDRNLRLVDVSKKIIESEEPFREMQTF